jgi:hypothetical protein
MIIPRITFRTFQELDKITIENQAKKPTSYIYMKIIMMTDLARHLDNLDFFTSNTS